MSGGDLRGLGKKQMERPNNGFRLRKWLMALPLALILLALAGCRTCSYYTQAAKGDYQILSHRQPIEKLIANPQTPPPLKEKLQLVQTLRIFAATELKLPVDKQYAKYVDVHRPFVVWNVEAAPEFSLEAKSWSYPFVGRLDYRGYFSERGATNYAARLQAGGYDVYVSGVTAYSTLGWFKDPVLNTFILDPEADLAETIFHELGHQRVFAHGDTDFNEAFATAVGQEGARRWLRARGETAAYDNYLARLRRTDQFVHLVMNTRTRLAALYGDDVTKEGTVKATKQRSGVPPEELRQQKQAAFDDLHKQYAQLRAQWGGDPEYDGWFALPLNNAQLNSVATYYDLLPGFERLLKLNGDNLEKFYQAAEDLAKKPKKERRQSLKALGSSQAF
jgi:predicted aminopeptidase